MRITTICFVKSAVRSILLRTEKDVTINAPWGKIRGLSWGDPSNPPILLCHGRLDACTSFRPLVSMLPESFHYVSIDLPGNGRSDHLPKGITYSALDLVPTILKVQEHFNWTNFMYIGHSMGALIGKYFDTMYPNCIQRSVELDPYPAYITFEISELRTWYKYHFEHFYSDSKYMKINGGLETAPKYPYDKILEMTMKNRGLSRDPAEQILERSLVASDDGMFRITYDQRMKTFVLMPFTSKQIQQLYTSISTPTFCFLASETIQNGIYEKAPFIMDEKAWPYNNYKFKIVKGGHDVHVENPKCVAQDISDFLTSDK